MSVPSLTNQTRPMGGLYKPSAFADGDTVSRLTAKAMSEYRASQSCGRCELVVKSSSGAVEGDVKVIQFGDDCDLDYVPALVISPAWDYSQVERKIRETLRKLPILAV